MKRSIIVAAALTALIFSSCTNNNNQQQNKEEMNVGSDNLNDVGAESNYISKDTANKMIQSYLTSIASDTTNNIQSIILNANTLRSYLNDTSIKHVKVMFAHTLEYINSGHNGQPAGYTPNEFTIVISGYNIEGNYVLAPGNVIPDKAKPCPFNCTTFGNASNPLIVN